MFAGAIPPSPQALLVLVEMKGLIYMRNQMYEPAFTRKENEMNNENTIKTMSLKSFKTLTYLKIAALSESALAAISFPIIAVINDNYLALLLMFISFGLISLLLNESNTKSESEIHHDDAELDINESCKQELQRLHERLHHIYEEYYHIYKEHYQLRPDLPHEEALAQLHNFDNALGDIKKELSIIEAKYSDPWSVKQLGLEKAFVDQVQDDINNRRYTIISNVLLKAVLADEKFPVYLEACAPSILEKTIQNLERIPKMYLYPRICRLNDDGQQINILSVLESEKVVGDEILTVAPPHAYRSIVYYDLAGNVVSSLTSWAADPFDNLVDDLIVAHSGYRNAKMREALSMADGEELDIDSRDTIDNALASLRKRLATLTARQS